MEHLVSAAGIKLDLDKSKLFWDQNFFVIKKSKFSAKLADLCKLTYAVTGNRHDWYWDEDQKKLFDDIKLEILKAPVQGVFDISQRHRVSVDSSGYAIGAALSRLNDCNWQPVVYASQKTIQCGDQARYCRKKALATT